jgi:hypothetical protein
MAFKPVTFDASNREIRSVRFYFEDANDSVSTITWEPGIANGVTVKQGDLLATIVFASSPQVPIHAPPGCDGVVDVTNRRIPYDELDDWGVWLLSLER